MHFLKRLIEFWETPRMSRVVPEVCSPQPAGLVSRHLAALEAGIAHARRGLLSDHFNHKKNHLS